MDKKEQAISLFEDGFNCSQAVLSVFCEDFQLDRETALKISSGLGGGAGNGELCGAVSGAIMVIGLLKGFYDKGDDKSRLETKKLTKEFTERFRNIHGDIVCKKLLGYDLSKPDEYELLLEKGSFKRECPEFIKTSVEILEKMR
jgi:C_GCAxxG_C_C family probable redox protein